MSWATTLWTAARSWIGTGGKRAVEFVERTLGRQAGRALDQVAFELASEVLLEFSELVSWEAVVSRVVLREVRLGIGPQAEGSPDSLHVDAEDAGALAATEGGDGQAGQVAHRVVGAVSERGGDLLPERVEIDVAVVGPGTSGLR